LLATAAVLTGSGILASPAMAQTGQVTSFNIPAGPLSRALAAFGQQSGTQLSYEASIAGGLSSPGAQGALSREAALGRILAGSGLTYSFDGPRNVIITRSGADTTQIGPDGSVVLNTVVLQGQRATTEGSGSYTSDVVTIGKGEQDIRQIPQSVSVVTRKQMDDQNVITIDDALEDAPGVALYDSPMGARYVYSRGFMVDTYQYDGVNRSLYYPQANSFSEDMAAFDRVEILRGATGLLQGAGNPGAAVNLVRKRPLKEERLTVTQQVGSNQNFNTEIDASRPLTSDGRVRGRIVGSFNDREYSIDLAESRNLFLYGVIEADLDTNTSLMFGGSYKHRTSTPCFHGLPTYADGTDIGLPRDTCLGQSWNSWDTDQLSLFGEVTHQFNDDWTWKTSLDYWRETHDVKYSFSEGAIDPVTLTGSSMYAGIFDMKSSNIALDTYVDGKYELLGRTHSVTFGASINDLVSDNDFSLARLDVSQNVFDPVRLPEVADAWISENAYRSANVRTKVRQTGVYGVTRLSVTDPLTVIIGGRLSWYKSTSVYRETGEDYASPYSENGVFTPYGGIVYDLGKDWSAYASYAEIFKPQSEVSIDGNVLEPIRGTNYEIGLKGSLMDGRVNTSMAIFRTDNENRAEFDSVNYPCSAGMWGECYVASGRVRTEGFEIEASGEVLPNLQIAASYTYAHAEFLDGESTVSQSFSTYNPEHMLKLWGDYQFTGQAEGLSLGAGVRFQSESSRKSGDVTLAQPSYAVWDARIAYDINENFSAALNVDNLFDKRYYQTVGAPGWGNFYGEPRSMMLSVKATF